MKSTSEKIPCINKGIICVNDAVGEFDLGDGRGVKFYCRRCCELADVDISDPDTYELDESLVFCEREWLKQA